MKLIIYCDRCGILLPNAIKRGECCAQCASGHKEVRASKAVELRTFRRPNAARILATIRREVRIPQAV
ncbi:MAG TPA: hypothetical protein VEK08_02235 [Planctomycetota bacterium]|nr:hypothetical protein [Planctomycetota bacterium]